LVIYLVLDMHVHLTEERPDAEWVWSHWPGEERRSQPVEVFTEKMDSCRPRIDRAVVFGLHSLASETPEAMRRDNDYILRVVEEHPDRFIGAGVVDPSWGDAAVEELHRFVDAGLRVVKIRFSSMHYHANNKAAQKVFREIEELGVLPVCHSDWTHYSNPLILGDLASMFPDVRMVMQHFGEYLSFDAISVCRKLPNVYVDTSALVLPKNIVRFMEEVSPDRIIYASDTLSVRGGLQPQDALNRVTCLGLPKKMEEKVLGGNAEALLRSVGVKL
jgi:predicted TIM-barrel fold metal-dependent hydrolase